MRHIGTVIAAAVVGPAVWILLAIGQPRSAAAFQAARDGGIAVDDVVRPLLLLVAGGLVLGLLAMLRFSPLGAVLVGAGYLASYLGPVFSPGLLDLVDRKPSLAGHQIDLAAPVRSGTTLVLGALLLVGVVSAQRWRRWPRPVPEEPAAIEPDEIIPAELPADRPLGADGLDLPRRDRGADRLSGGPLGADGPDLARHDRGAERLPGGPFDGEGPDPSRPARGAEPVAERRATTLADAEPATEQWPAGTRRGDPSSRGEPGSARRRFDQTHRS
ncbi:hypothetical protein AB0J86_17530 [Micromonospora sp. NPDC049559]|uniref:hypothetical protein n=1 Tax=Micromonospora sp. NPDC049559 TaxID=3155923 RepID=UPI00342D6A36